MSQWVEATCSLECSEYRKTNLNKVVQKSITTCYILILIPSSILQASYNYAAFLLIPRMRSSDPVPNIYNMHPTGMAQGHVCHHNEVTAILKRSLLLILLRSHIAKV